jgi:phosphoglucomutase
MNVYTVAKATAGLGDYIISAHPDNKSVAIGYDTRNNSEGFARLTATILAAKGIKVYLWGEALPTPMLSFAVRALGCSTGIMLTASHNPSKYNGYKVYRADGCQITEEAAAKISECIGKKSDFGNIPNANYEDLCKSSLIEIISDDVYEAFIGEVMANSMLKSDTGADKSVKIVYTALNGTGRRPVLDVLSRCSFSAISTVAEQMAADGNFPTCPYPNPEIPEAMSLGLEYAEKMGAEILLATDPDCDRVGVGVRKPDGSYTLLTGNEIGLLLLEFICKRRTEAGTMPKSAVMVKTIVTTDLAEKIADSYKVKTANVLTGFKYIGDYIGELEAAGRTEDYILGFEESCGYLTAGYVRDKDGVLAAMLISELAAYYAAKGIGLYAALTDIYRTYGYCKNSLRSYTFEGNLGFAKMQSIMKAFRGGISSFGGLKVLGVLDYKDGLDGLPPSDVLKFKLEGGSTVVIRPSGTEPKLKAYFSASADSEIAANEITERMVNDVNALMK